MANNEAVRRLQATKLTSGNLADQLSFTNPGHVGRASFLCLDAIQRENEAVQLLALAQLLLLHCRKYCADPREILGKARALLEDGLSENNQHVGAIMRVMKVHLKDGDASTLF